MMVIKEQKAATAAAGDEGDTILAFVALGGREDKGGVISADKLRSTCKVRRQQPPPLSHCCAADLRLGREA